jgi:ABC-2 type transport system permease protein
MMAQKDVAMHSSPVPARRILRGACNLFLISLVRLLRSRQSWICLLLLAFALLAVIAWGRRPDRPVTEFVDQILLGIFASFLLPIFGLCYGTAGIAADREEETLVYILVSPVPRPIVYGAKLASALVIVVAWTFISLSAICVLAGSAGRSVWWTSTPPALLGALAYASLFHLFGVIWRRAALVGLAYTFFFEVLLSNIPGIAQRFAVAYYLRNLLSYPSEADVSRGTVLVETLSSEASRNLLGCVFLGLVVVGTVWFSRREY